MNFNRKKRLLRIAARTILFFLAVFMVCAMAVKASPAEPSPVEPTEPVIYDVPLSDDLQLYIAELCEEHHIEPEIIIGIIEQESNFDPKVVGDYGRSIGLMQIQPRWHKERMEYLGCWSLEDPYANVKVGIDIFAELMAEYQDAEKALMVYNAGATGAQTTWFSKGIYSNEYSRGVLEKASALIPKEVNEMNIPDNHDILAAHEREMDKRLEALPKCGLCGDPIQQDTAFHVNGVLYCDECLDLHRTEVVSE